MVSGKASVPTSSPRKEGLLTWPVSREVSPWSQEGADRWLRKVCSGLRPPRGCSPPPAGLTGRPAALSRNAGAMGSTICQLTTNPSPPLPVRVQGDVGGRGLEGASVYDWFWTFLFHVIPENPSPGAREKARSQCRGLGVSPNFHEGDVQLPSNIHKSPKLGALIAPRL